MKIIKLKESDLVNAIKNALNEQETGVKCEYKNWKNGDGINKPKITIQQSKNGVIGTYIGPETGFCIQHSKGSTKDSIHQLAGVVSVTVAPLLKTLYGQGNFVKPSLKDISMQKDDNFFQISIPFISTTEDKAITNFNERGGWGHDAAKPIADFMVTIEGNPKKYGLIEKETKTASGGKSPNITEHWVSFRDLGVYPIKTQPTKQNAQNQQQPVASKPAEVQGLSFLQLLEKVYDYKMEGDTATAFNIVSPLTAGRIGFKLSKGTYSCTWGLKPDEPYFDDNMKFQLVQRGGKITTTIVTGDGDKIPIDPKYFNGMSCKAIQ